MKKYIYIILAWAAIFSFAACVENVEINPDENGPVYLSVSMEQPATKATIGESTGAFAFSNGDAIKIYNGNGVYTGTTTSTSAEGTFAMESEFENTGSGFAGFPAGLVSTITGSGVTFILPASYEYAEVGSADPDAAKVPCPMMGDFTAGSKITLKQAGAVVRFRVTNIAAGSLSFTFPTKVTGEVTLSAIPDGENGGILAGNLSTYGNTITVSSVPAVASGNYIYITLPVPTGTAPQGILVTNTPSDPSKAIRMQSLTGSSTALVRHGGYKLGVNPSEISTPSFTINKNGDKVILAPGNLMAKIGTFDGDVATASEWKFGGYLETVGDAHDAGNYLFAYGNDECVGKWVDLFCWQGASATIKVHGLARVADSNSSASLVYIGNVAEEDVYTECWDGLEIENGGGYTWRSLSRAEWEYIFSERTTSTLDTVPDARHARATVSGINGILIFPDNIGSVWNTGTMGSYPSDINKDKKRTGESKKYVYGTDNYTSSQFLAMSNVGVVFLPCTGYTFKNGIAAADSFRKWGYYWTKTGGADSGTMKTAGYLNFNPDETAPVGVYKRNVARAVRLARDLN